MALRGGGLKWRALQTPGVLSDPRGPAVCPGPEQAEPQALELAGLDLTGQRGDLGGFWMFGLGAGDSAD